MAQNGGIIIYNLLNEYKESNLLLYVSLDKNDKGLPETSFFFDSPTYARKIIVY